MKKLLLAQAKNLQAPLTLELSTYYSAKDLRSVQNKLTCAARDIRNLTVGGSLLGQIGGGLSVEQRQLLRDAAGLIEAMGLSIEHAKEKRLRSEAATKKRTSERATAAKKIIAHAFPLVIATLENKLDVIRLALALNRAGCFQSYYTPVELSLRYRNFVTDPSKITGWEDPRGFWEHKIASFRDELQQEIEYFLTQDDTQTVQQRYLALQHKVATFHPQVIGDPYEIETVSLWSQALSTEDKQESDE